MASLLPKYRQLFEAVKKGNIANLYFLYGPEEYMKKEFIRGLLDAALPEGNRAFNLDILYGDEFDRATFDDRLGSFPLFNERRVVILRAFDALSPANKDVVVSAAENVPASVVFVVESAKPKLDNARAKKLAAIAGKRGVAFACGFLDERETIERVLGRLRREGFEVDDDAMDLLVECAGTHLIDLSNEVDKLMLAAAHTRHVRRETVAAVVGKYRAEDVFSLLDLLARRTPGALIERLNAVIDGGEEPVFVLAMLQRRVVHLLEVSAHLAEGAHGGRALAGRLAGASSPYYADILARQAAAFAPGEIERLLGNLRWADIMLKSTSVDARTLVETALLSSHLHKTLATPVRYS